MYTQQTTAAAAKLLQSCPTLRSHRWGPTRLPHPWDSPGMNTGVGCHFLLQCIKVKSESEVAQSCPTLCDPIDGSPPGSPIPGILQARTLEWVAISFSNASKWKVKGKSHRYLQLLCLPLGLIPWSLCSVLPYLLYLLYFKVYFVWYEDCYSSFLFLPICMECIF